MLACPNRPAAYPPYASDTPSLLIRSNDVYSMRSRDKSKKYSRNSAHAREQRAATHLPRCAAHFVTMNGLPSYMVSDTLSFLELGIYSLTYRDLISTECSSLNFHQQHTATSPSTAPHTSTESTAPALRSQSRQSPTPNYPTHTPANRTKPERTTGTQTPPDS